MDPHQPPSYVHHFNVTRSLHFKLFSKFSLHGQQHAAARPWPRGDIPAPGGRVTVKTKFHYAIWFEAGSKLVADLLARASSLLAS